MKPADRRQLLALIPVGLAILLPAGGWAGAAGQGDPARTAELITGFQLFRILLAAHGVALWFALRPRAAGPGPGTTRAGPDRRDLVMLGLLLLAGLTVRLIGLGQGLWYDEIQTLVEYVRLPMGQIVTSYDNTNQHLLYSILGRLSVVGLGESPAALRLPAALLGVASLAAVWWFGREVAGRREALLAALALTFSYHHVWFSQNARGYTGLLCFTLISTGLVLRLLDGTTRRPALTAVAYGTAAALGAMVHVTAVFVAVGHGLVWLWLTVTASPEHRKELLRAPLAALLLSASLTLQLYAVVLPQVITAFTTPSMEPVTKAWKSTGWFALEALRGLSRGVPGGLLSVGIAAGFAGLGLASFWRRSPAATLVMLLPVASTTAVLLALHHNLWPRFFFFAAGFAVLILLRGWFTAWERWGDGPVRWATGLAALGSLAQLIILPRAWAPKQDFVGAARFVEQSAGSADAVAVVDLTQMPFQRYLEKPWPVLHDAEDLEALERDHPRTWVLAAFPERLKAVEPGVAGRLEQSYEVAGRFPGTLGGGAIIVYASRPTTTP